MAQTSSKGFFLRKSLVGIDNPPILEYIITTSAQITIGDAIEITDDPGYAAACDADDKVVGVCVGIVTKDGINIFGPNAPTVDGTISGDDTYTASATNKTSQQVKVQVVYPDYSLFYNEADSTLTAAEVGRDFALTATGDQVTGTGDGTARTCQLVELLSTASGPNSYGEGLFRFSRTHWTNVA